MPQVPLSLAQRPVVQRASRDHRASGSHRLCEFFNFTVASETSSSKLPCPGWHPAEQAGGRLAAGGGEFCEGLELGSEVAPRQEEEEGGGVRRRRSEEEEE